MEAVMSAMLIRIIVPFCVLLGGVVCAAGHEHDAKPPEQLGQVSFANSCSSAVQPLLQRGVALLHSFWWKEGRQTFLKVLDEDPACAIATWGVATINIGNPFATGPTPADAQQAQDAITRGQSI